MGLYINCLYISAIVYICDWFPATHGEDALIGSACSFGGEGVMFMYAYVCMYVIYLPYKK